MSIGEKLKTIADNCSKIYITAFNVGKKDGREKGYQEGYLEGSYEGHAAGMDTGYKTGLEQEYDRFWNVYQDSGNRTNYSNAFCGIGWTDESFRPKYDLIADNVSQMFREAKVTDLKKALSDWGVSLDTGSATHFTQFVQLSSVTVVPVLDMRSATNTTQAFGYAPVTQIEKLIVSEQTPWSNTFISCGKLTEIRFEGQIGTDGLSFAYSKQLSYDSLMSILGCLKDYSEAGVTRTVTLGADNLAKLTDEEKALATEKGWTLV